MIDGFAIIAAACADTRLQSGYEPLVPSRMYRVLVTDYLAAGGDGFGPVLSRCSSARHEWFAVLSCIFTSLTPGIWRVSPVSIWRVAFVSRHSVHLRYTLCPFAIFSRKCL